MIAWPEQKLSSPHAYVYICTGVPSASGIPRSPVGMMK
jgi:hypothetical protein